jgi:hydroxysqualene dehydroxylase
MTSSPTPDVIVVGAGLAGLSAAVALAARGARVLVLEAKAVTGGRATAFNDPQTGERVDNGQHVLLGCYEETFSFLRRIGTEHRVLVQPGLEVDFVDRAGARSRLRLPSMPSPLNLVAGLFDWEALAWRDRVAALSMARPIRIAQAGLKAQSMGHTPSRIAASPGETVEEWLIANGQTARLREMLWEPLALAALNQSIREAAAPPFAGVLARMFSGGDRASSLALPLCPLDELYAEPSRAFIEARAGTVRIGSPARVRISGDRVQHVEVRGETVHAGAVIAAVPWYALPDLFVGNTEPLRALQRAAAGTSASPIASVNLWLDRPIMQARFLGLPGRTMQWVFDKGQLFQAGTSHLTLVASGADDILGLSNDELIAVALDEVRTALPEARAAKVLRASVVRERRATFSLAPGQPARPHTRTAVERLLLAGDWVETGLPATIEGAALSGRLAAEAVS